MSRLSNAIISIFRHRGRRYEETTYHPGRLPCHLRCLGLRPDPLGDRLDWNSIVEGDGGCECVPGDMEGHVLVDFAKGCYFFYPGGGVYSVTSWLRIGFNSLFLKVLRG